MVHWNISRISYRFGVNRHFNLAGNCPFRTILGFFMIWTPVNPPTFVNSCRTTNTGQHWSTLVNTGKHRSTRLPWSIHAELLLTCSLSSILSTKNLIWKRAVWTMLASCGFRHLAVYVWSYLPDNIREANTCHSFKRILKTHLCKLAFGT